MGNDDADSVPLSGARARMMAMFVFPPLYGKTSVRDSRVRQGEVGGYLHFVEKTVVKHCVGEEGCPIFELEQMRIRYALNK